MDRIAKHLHRFISMLRWQNNNTLLRAQRCSRYVIAELKITSFNKELWNRNGNCLLIFVICLFALSWAESVTATNRLGFVSRHGRGSSSLPCPSLLGIAAWALSVVEVKMCEALPPPLPQCLHGVGLRHRGKFIEHQTKTDRVTSGYTSCHKSFGESLFELRDRPSCSQTVHTSSSHFVVSLDGKVHL
jgi:hypothetical protein